MGWRAGNAYDRMERKRTGVALSNTFAFAISAVLIAEIALVALRWFVK
jgi:hypothetical protein